VIRFMNFSCTFNSAIRLKPVTIEKYETHLRINDAVRVNAEPGRNRGNSKNFVASVIEIHKYIHTFCVDLLGIT
jgi:hypothetical protein